MKKIQRLGLSLLLFLCLGQMYGQTPDPIILCPPDLTISCNEDYTDTSITGVANATGVNGPEGVEYSDIIINLNEFNEGFARRRWNVVGRSDIFCDQTILLSCFDGVLNCAENIVATLTNTPTNEESKIKIFAESLVEIQDDDADVKVSRDGIYFHDFITFDCCDLGFQTFYGRVEDENGNIHKCENQILVEDSVAPTYQGPQTIHLGLYGNNSVELTLEALEPYISSSCTATEATFSQSIFTTLGEYNIDFTLSDESGNTFSGSIVVVVSSGNSLVCNSTINVSLDNFGKATITPEMVASSFFPLNGALQISINDSPFAAQINLDCTDIGSNQFVLQDIAGNQCFGTLMLEDKLAPFINIQEQIYLSLNGDNEVELTAEMLTPYTLDNCGIISHTLSQSVFNSEGVYIVTYTVTDMAGLSFSQDIEVTVTQNAPPIVCYNLLEIDLNEEGTATISPNTLLVGTIFLNYNLEVGIDSDPNQIVEYFDEITLDCSNLGTQFTIISHESGNSCLGQLKVNDVTPPIPLAKNTITVTLDGNEPYILLPSLLDQGSFDDCGEVAMTVSPNTFTAPGTYEVKLRVYDESGNSDFATSTVIVQQGSFEPIECIGVSTVLTDPFGSITTMHAVDFVLNPFAFDSYTMSTEINGTYTETIDFDCSMYPSNEAFPIFVRGEINGEFSTCMVLLTIIDNIPPVVVVSNSIILQLVNGQATLTPEEVDNGSYDNCGELSLSLNQTLFTPAHIGTNIVTLTAIDDNGNINSAFTEVIVVGEGSSCSVDYVIFPDNLVLIDEDGTYDDLSVENLQSIYNLDFEDVHPYTVDECNDLAYAYEDQVIITDDIIKVLRSFTVINWTTTNIRTEAQIIELILTENPPLICIENPTINVNNGSVQLFPQDLLLGDYNFSTLELSITLNGTEILNNVITPNYAGLTLYYQITDTATGNSCLATLTVVNDQNGCPLDIDTDVSFPLESIFLSNSNIDASEYTPENLVNDYGFAEADVNVIIDSDCAIAASAYEDQVFILAGDNYKIVRTFSILDWLTYDPMSQTGIYTFEQTINVGIDPNTLICDVLPNSAPVGNCDTGHTLEDDVEWPSDLQISDYNITPDDLIAISGIAEEDAMPIFFNNPDDYTATYIDLLIDLTSTTLTFERVWKAVNNTYDISWNYSQNIVIDFTDFQNLVTVNTATDRVVPGVIINNSIMTNEDGEAQVVEEIVSIDFEDEVKNGLNVKDLIIIQRHILGLEHLDERLILAADADSDNEIKASDILNFSKRIVGATDELEWKFIESTDNTELLKPKAVYTAYKLGDVDDSAVLPGEELVPTSKILIDDRVLNNGETYMIPISVSDEDLVMGVDIRMNIDIDLIDQNSIGIVNNLSFDYENFYVTPEGELTILLFNYLEAAEVDQNAENAVVYLEFKANANTLLSYAISVEDKLSFVVDEEINLTVLATELDNEITGNNSPELASVQVYPNPTSDYLIIDINDVEAKGDFQVTILNAHGQALMSQSTNSVDVQSLASGIYYYDIKIGGYEKKGKFMVLR